MTEIIDLDKLLPEPKKIKISGKVLMLYPGKIKTLIKIQKAFAGFKEASTEEQSGLLESVVDTLVKIIPDIKNDDVDIGIEQLPEIINIAYQSSIPKDLNLAKKNKMATDSPDQKKMPKTSQEQ